MEGREKYACSNDLLLIWPLHAENMRTSTFGHRLSYNPHFRTLLILIP